MKRLFFGFFALVLLFMFSCSDEISTVSGTVEASYLKGVKVCFKGTDDCKTTDEKGRFEFKHMLIPATLEFKVGDTLLKELKIEDKNVRITPKVLAGDNETLASYIGYMLHNLVDTDNETCDLSNIKKIEVINGGDSTQLVDKIKHAIENSDNVTVSYEEGADNETVTKTITITKKDANKYAANNPGLVGKDNLTYFGVTDEGAKVAISFNTQTKKLHIEVSDLAMAENAQNNDDDNESISCSYVTIGDKTTAECDLTLTPKYENTVYEDALGEMYFISNSLIFGQTGSLDFDDADFVVAVQDAGNPIEINDIPFTDYNWLIPDGKDSCVSVINLAKDSNIGGTWTDKSDNISGTWQIDDSKDFLNIFEQNQGLGHLYMNIGGKTTSFIAALKDTLNEEGDYYLSFGVEAKEISVDDIVGTYYYYEIKDINSNPPVVCYGEATIEKKDDKAVFGYEDNACYSYDEDDEKLNETEGGKFEATELELNNPNKGVAKVSDKNAYLLFDTENGLLVFVDKDSGNMFVAVKKKNEE